MLNFEIKIKQFIIATIAKLTPKIAISQKKVKKPRKPLLHIDYNYINNFDNVIIINEAKINFQFM